MVETNGDLKSGRRRIVIFGCGYLGSRVANEALTRGWEVTGLTRNAKTAEALAAAGVRVVRSDLDSDAWHGEISGRYDYVVNTVGSAGGGLPGYWQSYVEGMRSILTWAKGRECGTFVSTGSVSVYPQRSGEVVTEDSAVGGGSDAAEPLLEAERLVRDSRCFSRWFILRLSGLYGPHRHFLLDQIRSGATLFPGTGTNRLNLIHRDDAAAAVLACLEANPRLGNTIYNVTSDVAAPKAEVAGWLARSQGAEPPVFGKAPPEASPMTRNRGRSGPVPDRLVSNARIRRELGWQPRYPDFKAGYQQIFQAEQAG